ncbi:hypothetical protein CDAR_463971 [Caerostris darwini]|uniref:Uncharacterized protein n=1 Tax=Caerostris darwini TaxID=1538125 RepID=A0AAV4VTV4_9ARAC|nr:hypothetical protein CDAR_463971 [Caerostris darwini]
MCYEANRTVFHEANVIVVSGHTRSVHRTLPDETEPGDAAEGEPRDAGGGGLAQRPPGGCGAAMHQGGGRRHAVGGRLHTQLPQQPRRLAAQLLQLLQGGRFGGDLQGGGRGPLHQPAAAVRGEEGGVGDPGEEHQRHVSKDRGQGARAPGQAGPHGEDQDGRESKRLDSSFSHYNPTLLLGTHRHAKRG